MVRITSHTGTVFPCGCLIYTIKARWNNVHIFQNYPSKTRCPLVQHYWRQTIYHVYFEAETDSQQDLRAWIRSGGSCWTRFFHSGIYVERCTIFAPSFNQKFILDCFIQILHLNIFFLFVFLCWFWFLKYHLLQFLLRVLWWK